MIPINLVFAADIEYSEHLLVCLTSIFINSKKSKFHIYILTDSPNSEYKDLFTNSVKKYGHQLTIIKVSNSDYANLKITHHVSLATYFRLSLSLLLPSSIDKIIYLDCDLIVLGDINELWNENLSTFPIAGVINACTNEHKASIGFNNTDSYFNGGVLLVNLKEWRINNYSDKLLKFATNNEALLTYWDQDVLNVIFKSNWKMLDPKWNVFDTSMENLEGAQIVHYVGAHKPWNYYCTHPKKNVYHQYRELAFLNPIKFEQNKIVFKVKNFIKKLIGV